MFGKMPCVQDGCLLTIEQIAVILWAQSRISGDHGSTDANAVVRIDRRSVKSQAPVRRMASSAKHRGRYGRSVAFDVAGVARAGGRR